MVTKFTAVNALEWRLKRAVEKLERSQMSSWVNLGVYVFVVLQQITVSCLLKGSILQLKSVQKIGCPAIQMQN